MTADAFRLADLHSAEVVAINGVEIGDILDPAENARLDAQAIDHDRRLPLFMRRPKSFPGRAVVGGTDRHVQIRHSQPIGHALLKVGEQVIVRDRRHHEGEARAGVLAEFDNEASTPIGADDIDARIVECGHVLMP
jgi:hypothetical protein